MTMSLKVNRKYVGKKLRSHVIWNENNPEDQITKGFAIHHIDENPLNDSIDNLQKMTVAEHNSIHKIGNTNTRGLSYSKEIRSKMSKAKLGNKYGLGRVVSEETRKKISLSSSGRKKTEETRKRLSESLKGRSAWNKGIPRTDEEKKKISESKKGQKNHLGFKNSEETKAKMSLSHLNYLNNKRQVGSQNASL